MKTFLNNIAYILIIFSVFGCSKDDKPNDDTVVPPEEVVLSPSIEVYNKALLENDYVLAVETSSKKSYLLNKTGQIVHEWNFDKIIGHDLELLPNGKLLGIFETPEPDISIGGYGGIIRIINKDGSINWGFNYSSSNHIAHHDVEMLSNGNILLLAWERITVAQAQHAGVNTDVDIFPETLIEVDPKTNKIVWEWHSFDHIVQDANPDISTYGVINENPQLININYHPSEDGDIMHGNGVTYDAVRDVIYLSVNGFSEVWVIDHSTTTQEAKTNTGGKYNKGGNLIYRFGNPEAYNNPKGKRLFFKNHCPNLLKDNVPGVGNFMIYNNGVRLKQSVVYEFEMPEPFSLAPNVDNEPQIVWSFTDPGLFYANLCGASRLKNGNTLICDADYGFWEVTSKGEVVWKYRRGDVIFWRCYAYGVNSPEIVNLGL